jgi:hypothetical protein
LSKEIDMGFYNKFNRFLLAITTAFALFVSSPVFIAQQSIPVTGTVLTEETKTSQNGLISLQDFVDTVKDGNAKKINGLYSSGTFSLRVIQQPSGKPGFVSPIEGVATQFSMAASNNITGMLAHNFASGRFFFDLAMDDVIDVVYGDGTIKEYKVTQVKQFQALSPKSSASDFVDLDSNEKLSATELFTRMYAGKHHLTLQTCIQAGPEDSWGRLFVIAEPVEA